jgi:hypothetical protein
MLPPDFWALAGDTDIATPNPATRNIRASVLERIAAFIKASSQESFCRAVRPVFRIVDDIGRDCPEKPSRARPFEACG